MNLGFQQGFVCLKIGTHIPPCCDNVGKAIINDPFLLVGIPPIKMVIGGMVYYCYTNIVGVSTRKNQWTWYTEKRWNLWNLGCHVFSSKKPPRSLIHLDPSGPFRSQLLFLCRGVLPPAWRWGPRIAIFRAMQLRHFEQSLAQSAAHFLWEALITNLSHANLHFFSCYFLLGPWRTSFPVGSIDSLGCWQMLRMELIMLEARCRLVHSTGSCSRFK